MDFVLYGNFPSGFCRSKGMEDVMMKACCGNGAPGRDRWDCRQRDEWQDRSESLHPEAKTEHWDEEEERLGRKKS